MSRAVTSSSTHVELFSGIGAFALGLGAGYRTVLAVDNDANKNMIYYLNHGRGALKAADIAEITTAHIPGRPDLLTADSHASTSAEPAAAKASTERGPASFGRPSAFYASSATKAAPLASLSSRT